MFKNNSPSFANMILISFLDIFGVVTILGLDFRLAGAETVSKIF